MKKLIILISLVILLLPISLNGKDLDNYGHISLIEGQVKIFSDQGGVKEGVLNLPLVSGDLIVTSDQSRCEFQFDNGTVVRLDKKSKLKIETFLANSLTTSKKVSTLFLKFGRLNVISKTYNQSVFEIVTPNASILMKKVSNNVIEYMEKDGTKIFVDLGQVQVRYGEDKKSLKTLKLKRKGYAQVNKKNEIAFDSFKLNSEFMLWNEGINTNFKELHYMKSNLPKKVYRFSPGVIAFVEKWSSAFGDWEYNELLGYVWKPADQKFALKYRPFSMSSLVQINGTSFLVPQLPWAWIPAKLGVWHWTGKKGWVWLPGDFFRQTSELQSYDSFPMNTLWACNSLFLCPYGLGWLEQFDWMYSHQDGYYSEHKQRIVKQKPIDGNKSIAGVACLDVILEEAYGSMDLFYTYLSKGEKVWKEDYKKAFKEEGDLPKIRNFPKNIAAVIKSARKMDLETVKAHLGTQDQIDEIKKANRSIQTNDRSWIPIKIVKTEQKPILKVKDGKLIAINPRMEGKNGLKNGESKGANKVYKTMGVVKHFRSFSPDVKFALRHNVKIEYDYKNNGVYSPRYGIHSNTISVSDRSRLNPRGGSTRPGRTTGGYDGSIYSGSTGTTSGASSTSSAATSSSSGSTGTATKED